MRLFLDTSVVLAACGRATGASRAVIEEGEASGWTLLVSAYVRGEVEANVPRLGPTAIEAWHRIAGLLADVPDVLTLDRPVVFPVRKDRPVLFTAAAWADVLLTLDRRDFTGLLGGSFYDLAILTPGEFLKRYEDARR